jgi:hypothetical protein
MYPLDTLRRRMICGSTFREAIRGRFLYRGLGLHVAKSIPECMIFAAAYMSLTKCM